MISTRREVTRALLSFGGAALLAEKAAAAEPHLDFPTKPHDRLSVTSYPFRAYLDPRHSNGKPAMDITGFVEMVAEKFDIHNLNPLADHFQSSSAEFISTVRASLEKRNSRIVDLGLSGKQFYSPDPARRQAAIDYGRKWIDVAAELGSPSVRQHVAGVRDHQPDVELAAASLGTLAQHGEKKNVVVNLENDSPGSEDPFFLVQVIEKAGSPYLRALPDFGNSLLPSGDAELNARAVRAMFRHVFNMSHVKDAVVNDSGQEYRVDLARLFSIARESGYRGYYCMETDLPGDPTANTAELIHKTLQYLS